MKSSYQVIDKTDSRALSDYLSREGVLLPPLLELIQEAKLAVDEIVALSGRAMIEALLQLDAQREVGVKHPGKIAGNIRRHGSQHGVIYLAERKLRVRRPRLRKKGVRGDGGAGAEVPLPVYAALQEDGPTGQRMLDILLQGVSTRRYREVLPTMAQTVGISKSSISRKTMVAGEKVLRELLAKDLSQTPVLVIYLDGIQFGRHHVLCALGVDIQGYKHVLGLAPGASENSTVVKELLEDLVQRGLDPQVRRLFVIDGAKALRAGIDAVFGTDHPVQRCRNHKIRNVLAHLPEEQHDQTKAAMRAAFKLDWKTGQDKLEQLAGWLEREGWSSAAGSLREGLEEMFTLNRLGLPASLGRCLCTTNVLDSSHAGLREKTRRVSRWNGQDMALRWAAGALLATAKKFRRIMGYQQLWMLQAQLEQKPDQKEIAMTRKKG